MKSAIALFSVPVVGGIPTTKLKCDGFVTGHDGKTVPCQYAIDNLWTGSAKTCAEINTYDTNLKADVPGKCTDPSSTPDNPAEPPTPPTASTLKCKGSVVTHEGKTVSCQYAIDNGWTKGANSCAEINTYDTNLKVDVPGKCTDPSSTPGNPAKPNTPPNLEHHTFLAGNDTSAKYFNNYAKHLENDGGKKLWQWDEKSGKCTDPNNYMGGIDGLHYDKCSILQHGNAPVYQRNWFNWIMGFDKSAVGTTPGFDSQAIINYAAVYGFKKETNQWTINDSSSYNWQGIYEPFDVRAYLNNPVQYKADHPNDLWFPINTPGGAQWWDYAAMPMSTTRNGVGPANGDDAVMFLFSFKQIYQATLFALNSDTLNRGPGHGTFSCQALGAEHDQSCLNAQKIGNLWKGPYSAGEFDFLEGINGGSALPMNTGNVLGSSFWPTNGVPEENNFPQGDTTHMTDPSYKKFFGTADWVKNDVVFAFIIDQTGVTGFQFSKEDINQNNAWPGVSTTKTSRTLQAGPSNDVLIKIAERNFCKNSNSTCANFQGFSQDFTYEHQKQPAYGDPNTFEQHVNGGGFVANMYPNNGGDPSSICGPRKISKKMKKSVKMIKN